MGADNLTAERLREVLHYDPLTGLFTWRVRRGRCAAGSIAGSPDDHGYIVIRIDWAIYKAGRLAWLYIHGAWPLNRIRYLDFDVANNRLCNLLDAIGIPKRPATIHPELTPSLLRVLTDYDKESGDFYWRNSDGTRGDKVITDIGKYVRLWVNGKRYSAHRLAWFYMTGCWPDYEIDHRDRVKTNNKWINLREATTKQNQENITPRKGTVSGVTGICWNKRTERWHTTLGHFGKRIFIGEFDDLGAAIAARQQAERKYFSHSPACAPVT